MDEAQELLVEKFRLTSFRGHQEAVIRRLLVDNENALAVMPTGASGWEKFMLSAAGVMFSRAYARYQPTLSPDEGQRVLRPEVRAAKLTAGPLALRIKSTALPAEAFQQADSTPPRAKKNIEKLRMRFVLGT
ncbi:hypothetical protein FRC00_010809 [Tulasnella sp. 408]|nr:hypothetical protein FRC00_010809 [Tulasnella sp. 408]